MVAGHPGLAGGGRHRRRRDPVRARRAAARAHRVRDRLAAIFRHVAESGHRIVNGTDRATSADVVVVAGHDDFNFGELRDATQAVLAGAEMIAAGPRPHVPGRRRAVARHRRDRGRARVRHRAHRPDRRQARPADLRRPRWTGSAPGRALMVGDRLDSDLAGAAAAGIDGAIVLSGVTTREQAEAAVDPAPVAIAEDLRCAGARVTLSLIVNPSAGGGRAGRALPEVQRALHALGLEHHAEPTRSLEHARELARGRRAGRRGRGRLRRRRAGRGGGRRAAASAGGVLGVLPGRPRQRLRPHARDPARAGRRLSRCCARGAEPRARSRRGGRHARSSGSPAAALTRWPTGSPTRPGSCAAISSTPTALLRALAGWQPATFTIELDGGDAAHGHRLHGRCRELQGLRRRHDARAGGVAGRRLPGRRDRSPTCPGCGSCACCRPCSTATHIASRTSR